MTTDNKYYVYSHTRPGSTVPFYIGKGFGQRAYKKSCRNPYWTAIANKNGFDVNFIATDLDEELAFLVEMEAIDKFKSLGHRLSNMTEGGEGVSGYVNPKGAHNKGVPCPDHLRKRISETLKAKGCLPPIGWNRGLKTSASTLEKRSISLKASWAKRDRKPITEETRAKMRAAKIGKKLSEEHKIKVSESLKANRYIRKVPDMTGFKHSEESKMKMSISKKNLKN